VQECCELLTRTLRSEWPGDKTYFAHVPMTESDDLGGEGIPFLVIALHLHGGSQGAEHHRIQA